MSFRRPEIIRPPSERSSYFLPITSGCSHHRCTFCNYYYGSKLGIREVYDVKNEIDALALYNKYGIQTPVNPEIVSAIARQWDGRRIFLQDGDALVYPSEKLLEILQYLNEKLPDLDRIAAYTTPNDVLQRDIDELKNLKKAKLGILYMGVESGDEEVLQKVGKGVSYHEIVEAGRKIKEAGIILSVTVILGLDGIKGSQKHSSETARILNDIDPDYVGALTLVLVPGTPLYEKAITGEFHPVSPFHSLEELKTLVENSNFTDCFFSSMHASNYFSIRGRLPYDRERVLKQLENILSTKDPTLLRPEFLRVL